jgi:hypothetical protein
LTRINVSRSVPLMPKFLRFVAQTKLDIGFGNFRAIGDNNKVSERPASQVGERPGSAAGTAAETFDRG